MPLREVKASIAVITYNHEQYIGRCLDSLLRQKTDFLFEIIVGEDCSNDNTAKIVTEYAERFPDIIKPIRSAANVGMTANIDRVEKACRGKYIAYCEGDDCWICEDKLQKQVDFLSNNPEYGLVHAGAIGVLQDGRQREIQTTAEDDLEKGSQFILTSQHRILTLTVCLVKDMLIRAKEEERTICDPEFKAADFSRWYVINQYSRIKYFPEIVAKYSILDESASHSKNVLCRHRFQESVYKLKRRLWENWNKQPEVMLVIDRNYWPVALGFAAKLADRRLASTAAAELIHLNKKLNHIQTLEYAAAYSWLARRGIGLIEHILFVKNSIRQAGLKEWIMCAWVFGVAVVWLYPFLNRVSSKILGILSAKIS